MEDEELTQEAHRRVGSTIGKYRLDAVLGVGGTASVYAGTHRNGNRVAVKVLHEYYASNEAMRARFLREGYVANKVDHPGTVRVLDDEATADGAFLVMDLLDGETLDARSLRTGGAMPVPDVVHHGIALLGILERAHANGIVHRDLKPENVFFTTQQELKILDFGIARLRDANVSATKTQMGTMLGTPAFLSPEQALGHMDEIDARTDLWATGATLYTLLSGHHVHEGKSTQETLVFAATRPAPPLKSLAPHVPDALAGVVDRALRFRREERWNNATEMKNALLATGLARLTVAGGRTAPLVAPSPGGQAATLMTSSTGASSGSSTSSIALAGALFGLVALGGIGGGLFYLQHRAVVSEPEFTTPLPSAASEPEGEPEPELLPLPSFTPDPPPPPPSLEPLVRDGGAPSVTAPKPAPKPVAPATKAPGETKDPWDPR